MTKKETKQIKKYKKKRKKLFRKASNTSLRAIVYTLMEMPLSEAIKYFDVNIDGEK